MNKKIFAAADGVGFGFSQNKLFPSGSPIRQNREYSSQGNWEPTPPAPSSLALL
jgi:hypothetical protein